MCTLNKSIQFIVVFITFQILITEKNFAFNYSDIIQTPINNDSLRLLKKMKANNDFVEKLVLKSNNASDLYLLDSTVNYKYNGNTDSVRTEKNVFGYDPSGRQASWIIYDWDEETNRWKKEGKSFKKFNNYGNILLEEYFTWDDSKNIWQPGLWYWNPKVEYKYNDEQKIIEQLFYFYFDEQNYSKTIWTYNTDGKEILKEDLNSYNDSINYNNRTTTTYSENNQVVTSLSERWTDELNKYVNSHKEINEYDTKGNLLKTVNYIWNMENNRWEGTSYSGRYEEYEYNENNQVITYLKGRWNENKKLYEIYKKMIYGYDNNGERNLSEEFSWSENKWIFSYGRKKTEEITTDSYFDISIVESNKYGNQKYTPNSKNLIKYNENKQVTDFESYYWNENTNIWEYSKKTILMYDDNNNRIKKETFQDLNKKEWVFDAVSEYKYDENNNLVAEKFYGTLESVVPEARWGYFHYYQDEKFTVSQNNANNINDNIKIYPNPTSQYISIDGIIDENVKISIVNIEGITVLSIENKYYQSIDLSALEKGIYFVKIAMISGNYTKKVLIK